MSTRITFVHLALVLLCGASRASGADAVATRRLPSTIHAAAGIRRFLEAMLQESSTFRRQCLRLEAPGVEVHIRRDPQILDRPYRARTVIGRAAGAIVAWVTISAYGDPSEWLAHELEHVIEQIDGVNLPALASGRRGAWLSVGDSFETERAIRVGRAVRQEVQAAVRASARAAKPGEASRGTTRTGSCPSWCRLQPECTPCST